MTSNAGSAANPPEVPAARPSGSFYRPELDVLRFVAFVMVFSLHALPTRPTALGALARWPWLQVVAVNLFRTAGSGLPLFFVLSAYLIATLLLREKVRTGSVAIVPFYIRRILRIWPLYLTALLLSFVAAWLVGDHRLKFFGANLAMLGNWAFIVGLSTSSPLIIGHLWSISVEEQFYLIFPAAASRLGMRGLWVMCILGVLLSVAAIFVFGGQQVNLIWENTFVQLVMFAAGIALGLRFPGDRLPKFKEANRLILAAASIALMFLSQSVFHLIDYDGHVSPWLLVGGYLLTAVACSLLLVSFLGTSYRFPPLLIYLGKVSFGLYVFHEWSLELATFLLGSVTGGAMRSPLLKDVLALGLTIALAALSYRFLEAPFLKLKDKFAVIHSRPV